MENSILSLYVFIISTLQFLCSGNPNYLRNHSVLSISGWPQSGTSLVYEYLQHTPGVTTMIEKCEQFSTLKKCVGFNFEGQWILPAEAHKYLSVNIMCSKLQPAREDEKQALLRRWMDAWDTSKHYLAEKSPQNMLKIPFLDSVYGDANKRKYLIVIKHPVTLNIAVPRKSSWKAINENCVGSKRGMVYTGRFKEALNPTNAMRTLGALLDDAVDGDTAKEVLPSCAERQQGSSMGWISSMHVLAEWLEKNRDFADKNVRILRYEDFEGSSHRVCLFLTSFFFGSDQEGEHAARMKELMHRTRSGMGSKILKQPRSAVDWDIDDIIAHCNKMFPFHQRKNSNAAGSTRQLSVHNDMLINTFENASIARGLRLHLGAGGTRVDKWSFRPAVATQSCSERMLRFADVYFNCIDQISRNRIDEWNEKLGPFGYGFRRGYQYLYSRKSTLFDDWDLMGSYPRYIPLAAVK